MRQCCPHCNAACLTAFLSFRADIVGVVWLGPVMPVNDACLRKIEYGAMLGGAVGATFGALFGGYEASRYRSISVAQRVGLATRATLGGAAVFGFFLAVGTAIRGCGGADRF